MNDSIDIKTGISTASICIITFLYFGGIELIGMLIFLSFFGWLGMKLYEIKTNSWFGLLLIKIPLNMFFNLFFFMLLLSSWTMLKYRVQLDTLDERLQENNLT